MNAVILPIPFRDPTAAFAPVARADMAVLLDSALPGKEGRFSYIACDPFRVLRSSAHPWRVTVDGKAVEADAFSAVGAELARFAVPKQKGPAPFLGGALGFFSYELGGVLENTPTPKDTPCPADMVVGLYDTIAAFDLERCEAWIIAQDFLLPGRPSAEKRAAYLAGLLGRGALPSPRLIAGRWHAEARRSEHEGRIASAIESIKRGDIYQANITQRFLAEIPADTASYDLYLHLRRAAAAPFCAFMNAGDGLHILSASPERFLKVDADGAVETRPIKGTRPRGRDAGEDGALARELLASVKDRAENLMIVDLLRNDLARVCAAGSVSVPVLCGLETFPALHHLVSVVTGRLRPGAAAIEVLCAAFPGGSITGAPKIKAMEIIHSLEPGARGPYCGTLAWFGFDGAMDSSIVIRTLVRHGGTLTAQAGGGIVAESDPAREFEESLTKVKPLLSVLEDAP
jgi:para-aminobenzoate synthetase component 1